MKKYYSLLLFIFLFSCSGSSTNETPEDGPPISEDEALAMEAGEMVSPIIELPKNIEALGNQFITGRKWKDANGENLVVFTFSEDEEADADGNKGITRILYAEHFIREKDDRKYTNLHKIEDAEKACSFDNMLYLDEKSISITDLDQDQYKEVSFVYTLGCVSDVSPYPMKLVLLENGDQYTVKGDVRLEQQLKDELGEEATLPESTSKNFDTKFESAPKQFRKFANELWGLHEMK